MSFVALRGHQGHQGRTVAPLVSVAGQWRAMTAKKSRLSGRGSWPMMPCWLGSCRTAATAPVGPMRTQAGLVDLPPARRGYDYFGILDEPREVLEATLDCKVDVVSIRRITPQATAMADRIRRETVPL